MPYGDQNWRVELTAKADKEMRNQPDSIRADFDYVREIIEGRGLHHVPWHYIKKLRTSKKSQDDIYELRLTGKNTIARALYLKIVYQRVIVVRVFTKKSQNTPPSEIRYAISDTAQACVAP